MCMYIHYIRNNRGCMRISIDSAYKSQLRLSPGLRRSLIVWNKLGKGNEDSISTMSYILFLCECKYSLLVRVQIYSSECDHEYNSRNWKVFAGTFSDIQLFSGECPSENIRYMQIHVGTHWYIYIHICTHVYIYIYVYIFIYVYVYIYIYIHICIYINHICLHYTHRMYTYTHYTHHIQTQICACKRVYIYLSIHSYARTLAYTQAVSMLIYVYTLCLPVSFFPPFLGPWGAIV